MTVARHQSPCGAMTGGWTLAVRVLALLLALAFAAPETGLAADLQHPLGAGHSTATMVSAAGGAARAADPGLAGHGRCGCHVAAPLRAADPVLAAMRPRPRYDRIARVPTSIVPDLLPRPPRA